MDVNKLHVETNFLYHRAHSLIPYSPVGHYLMGRGVGWEGTKIFIEKAKMMMIIMACVLQEVQTRTCHNQLNVSFG